PSAVQFFSVQVEFEVPFPVALLRIAQRLPRAFIPEHHRAATVLSLGNRALKATILKRMVFYLHRETLICRVDVWTFGHGPALEPPAELEPKVVMQMRRIMLLNDVRKPLRPGFRLLALWFRGSTKVPFRSILSETHETTLGGAQPTVPPFRLEQLWSRTIPW